LDKTSRLVATPSVLKKKEDLPPIQKHRSKFVKRVTKDPNSMGGTTKFKNYPTTGSEQAKKDKAALTVMLMWVGGNEFSDGVVVDPMALPQIGYWLGTQ